jgi:predicted Fe-S protein YdhL (DUF1289 family)
VSNIEVIRDGVDAAPTSAFFANRLAEIAHESPVPSPCVNICKIDPDTSVCFGCRRTLDEIAAWSRLDDDAKRVVWASLPLREPHP